MDSRSGGALSLQLLLCGSLGLSVGLWAGYSRGLDDGRDASLPAARAAMAGEIEACATAAHDGHAEARACVEALDRCRAANESSALALEALAAREEGCARFLTLDAWGAYRAAHAGKHRPKSPVTASMP
jgi:hypothetical protein